MNMTGVSFDWTIRAGDVLTILGMGLGGLAVLISMRQDLKSVQAELVELRKVIIAQVRAEEQLKAHEKRLDALERAT